MSKVINDTILLPSDSYTRNVKRDNFEAKNKTVVDRGYVPLLGQFYKAFPLSLAATFIVYSESIKLIFRVESLTCF